jgi:hypothetical protein
MGVETLLLLEPGQALGKPTNLSGDSVGKPNRNCDWVGRMPHREAHIFPIPVADGADVLAQLTS